jgi:2,3-bisphosphoglycerate-dependent phosphoglycerate mutase
MRVSNESRADRARIVNVYVVRHAQPERSTGLAYAVSPGPGLSACGRAQAASVARVIAARSAGARELTRVVASPFARARETADIIAGACGLEVETCQALVEQGPGEPWSDVERRVRAWWRGASMRAAGLVVVGHGATTNALLFTLGGKLDLTRMDADQNRTPQAGAWCIGVERRTGRTCRGELIWTPEDGTAEAFRQPGLKSTPLASPPRS